MSQPSTANDGVPSMDQGSFTQAQLDRIFGTVETDPSFYHQNNNGASEDLDFNFDVETYSTPPEFAAPSPIPVHDFSDYTVGQPSNGYPPPGPNTPHPYPIEQQQCFHSNLAVPLPIRPRPQVLRSQTNTSYLHPSHPPPQYTRRRSLSQGDAERIAAYNIPSNPTFLRLQTPRARAIDPDEHLHKRRAGSYKHGHSRSTSRDTNSSRSTRGNTPTSMRYNPNLLGGMIPTPIGTPMSPVGPRYYRPAAGQQTPMHYELPSQDVIFRQMGRPDQMERSRKIIEIGAIAVRAPLDPMLQDKDSTILKKLEEVEQYLKHEGGDCQNALEGCVAIREALLQKLSVVRFDGGANNINADRTMNMASNAPSTLLSTQGNDLFGGGADDHSLMAMLIQDTENRRLNNSP